ncbi:hypothetical protein JCM8547_003659 [Rhodosporidiobolus lusitaniae]
MSTTTSAIRSSALARPQKATQLIRSEVQGAGLGLIIREAAEKGDHIGLYGGEQFAYDEELAPGGVLADTLSHWQAVSYWFDVHGANTNLATFVDSQRYGSNGRHINSVPGSENVEPKIKYVSGCHLIAIYATKSIRAGSELYMEYGVNYPSSWGDQVQAEVA